MTEMIEFIPYPKFEDVFVEGTDPKAKFVFIPLVTIKISNHPAIGNKTLHFIAIWDTGDYESEYFGNYRTDVNAISFTIVGDKLEYKDPIRFPRIEFLEQAYRIILEDFDQQKEKYLELKPKSRHIERGGKLILDKIPEFGDFESRYYFERVTSYLLAKYRYEKYKVVNSMLEQNPFYIYQATDGKRSGENLSADEFNKTGKTDFVENFFEEPDFIQNDESPEHSIFIGQIDEWHYISSSSTNTYLFLDERNNRQIQIFQWD